MWPLACRGPPASGYLRTIQTRPGNDGEGDLRLGISVPIMLLPRNRWSPGHVAIEEIRGGAGSGGGDLLGLLLLFSLAANVAQGAELGAPREQKLEPLRGLMSCLSSGLRPAPQRSGRGLLCRTPTSAAQTAGALKI